MAPVVAGNPIYESPVDIFQHVYQTFLDSLSEQELIYFVSFPDAVKMLEAVHKLVSEHSVHQGILSACANKINNLAVRLRPFFDIVSIFVSSNPEFAAIAWGSICLVFKLGSHYVTFLEKICRMFDQMAALLPAYEDFLTQLTTGARVMNAALSTRALSIMSFVYSDLIHFCFDACKIFTKKKPVLGIKKLNWPLAATLMWQPFDNRFGAILARLREHRELMELEMSVSSHTQVSRISEKINSMLETAQIQAQTQGQLEKRQEQVEIDRRLDVLKHWINPPRWLCAHEYAQRRRTPKTSEWFLEHPKVKSWLGKIEEGKSRHFNILSIHGKPGFGKTTLCTALVDYLLTSPQTSSCDVVFFYFDQQSHDHRDVNIAFRAILSQLLQSHRGNKQRIDVTSLLWSQRQSWQITASDTEIMELLRLIQSHTGQLVLVLDGIDECSDHKYLFSSLQDLGFIVPEYSIALFSRPTVQLPNRLAQMVNEMTLVGQQNIRDIRRFLQFRVQELVDDGILPHNQNIDETAKKISNRANGMFLWVTLLVDYLASPGLTKNQRRNTVENLNRLEGLDSLYSAIIRSLASRFTGEARENVQKLFQWVSCSFRPLLVSELQCAIAIPLDRSMEEGDDCEEFPKALSPMSGALLEVDFNDRVRFIHLSAREFCQGLDAPIITPSPGLERSFPAFSGPPANVYCSTACLSYLYLTVKHRPLAGSSQVSLDRPVLSKQYPFLDYVSQYWSKHMLEAVKSLDPARHSITTQRKQFTELLELTAAVLGSQETITTWIESSWSFGRIPSIISREPEVNKILYIHRSDESVRRNINTLRKLSEDLARLSREWGHVLKDSPNEIWEPSISGFLESNFWVTAKGSEVTMLKPNIVKHGEGFICIMSQVSVDGTEIGTIKVKPPRRTTGIIVDLDAECNPEDGVSMEDPIWRVRYEIWQLNPHKLKICISFHVPASMVPFPYIYKKPDVEAEEVNLQFIFPTSLSADLRHASFLNIAGTLIHGESGNNEEGQPGPTVPVRPRMQLQVIDFTLEPEDPFFRSLNLDWRKFYKGFWTHMSNSGEYLLVLHILPKEWDHAVNRSEDVTKADRWLLRIFRNTAFSTGRGPTFSFISAIVYKPDRVSEIKDRPFIFHPELPLLALSTGRTAWAKAPDSKSGFTVLSIKLSERKKMNYESNGHVDALTMIWNFGRNASKPVGVQCLMRELHFSNDGTKLYGIVDGEKVMMDVPLRELGVDTVDQIQEASTSLIMANKPIIEMGSRSALISLSNGPSSQAQPSNSLVFSRDNEGRFVATDLRQSKENGALVLRTLREDSAMTYETLARLPRWVDDRIEATLIHREGTSAADADEEAAGGAVHVVLNRKAGVFEKYSGKDATFVPTIIERQQDTIPKFVSSGGVEDIKMLASSRTALTTASSVREESRKKIRQSVQFGDL